MYKLPEENCIKESGKYKGKTFGWIMSHADTHYLKSFMERMKWRNAKTKNTNQLYTYLRKCRHSYFERALEFCVYNKMVTVYYTRENHQMLMTEFKSRFKPRMC